MARRLGALLLLTLGCGGDDGPPAADADLGLVYLHLVDDHVLEMKVRYDFAADVHRLDVTSTLDALLGPMHQHILTTRLNGETSRTVLDAGHRRAHLDRSRITLWRVAAVVGAAFAIALLVASMIGTGRAGREWAIFDVFQRRGSIQQDGPPVPLRADLVANERGWLALLPPAPLGALAIGQGDVYPNYIKVTARSLDALVSGDQIEHPLAVASGQFDVAFVILFLYPLLIFAVSFDLTATERDQGTLRMVLAQPVTIRDVIAGKMIVHPLPVTP